MTKTKPIGYLESICLLALLMSLVALSIDAMLPALSQIGASLGVQDANKNQYIISTLFFGMASGLMFYGPLSDSYGRKFAIYLGILVFLVGIVVSILSTNLDTMLIGRFLQGFGAAACRVVVMSMIRDQYQGKEMAKIMSLIMTFFILVPAIAPSIGQAILFVSAWQGIFVFMFLMGFTGVTWLYLRQPETLAESKRLPFSWAVIVGGIKETVANKAAFYFTLCGGALFGAFVGYLSSAQQIFQSLYLVGNQFSLYFGVLALAIGASTLTNAKLVMKYKMENLCLVALVVLFASASIFYLYVQSYFGKPPIVAFMFFMSIALFCFGILIGNLNTLSLQPLGHIAGIANSVMSSIQTFLSVLIGGYIGQQFDGTINALVMGFVVCSFASLIIFTKGLKNLQA